MKFSYLLSNDAKRTKTNTRPLTCFGHAIRETIQLENKLNGSDTNEGVNASN